VRRGDILGAQSVDHAVQSRQRLAGMRALLLLGWVLATVGYFGPWIAHPTAALTLSGGDMGEFVKFLPEVANGALPAVRQGFYLPPMAVVLSVGLLVGSPRLAYAAWLRALLLLGAIPVSLQLLPPAWSVASLLTAEFRAQSIVLGILWLTLCGFWVWARLPLRVTGSLSALFSLAALVVAAAQFLLVKPAIGQVYGMSPRTGWGFFLCMAGLGIISGTAAGLALQKYTPKWSQDAWSAE
jgi:hypothetical protein